MARIQILELPEGADDERPPFIIVVDEWDYESIEGHDLLAAHWDAFGQKVGARGVLFAECTIDIPANEITLGPDGYPIKLRFEGDFQQLREQVRDEVTQAQASLANALRTSRRT
ncbi:hypothetical protein AB0F20_05765 [Streptomyces goshikiensis]|uniref:hypothetical protein n=1 Tax=Streptomyces goshikiensis TaxID=1942 RepID=UPI0033C3F0BB